MGPAAGNHTERAPARFDLLRRGELGINRFRLVVLALLALLAALGLVGGDRSVPFLIAVALASAVAFGLELVLRRHSWRFLPIAIGIFDGVTIGALVALTGGARSQLDVLFPLAIFGASIRPAVPDAIVLVLFDLAVYLESTIGQPAFDAGGDPARVMARAAVFAVAGVAAWLIARGREGAQVEAEAMAQRRLLQEGAEAARVNQLVLDHANFIAMLTHELRTPLTSIKGFAQLLLRNRADEETTARYTSVMLAESNRMTRIISDALDLVRVRSGYVDLRPEPLAVGPMVDCAIVALEHHDPDRRLRSSVPENLPPIVADRNWMERIVVNLLASALKYSQDGMPIEIGATGEPDGAVIWVQGHGIKAAKFDHIFRHNGSEESDFCGSGLGLYIAKNLIEAQGGRLWIEEADGQCSRLAIRLGS